LQEVPEKNIRTFKQHKVIDDKMETEPEKKKSKQTHTNKINTNLLSKVRVYCACK
jgi:hypothetical protein